MFLKADLFEHRAEAFRAIILVMHNDEKNGFLTVENGVSRYALRAT
jgi:hypothetical protein